MDRSEMQNAELCRVCDGRCCERMGCYFSPDDFKILSYGELEKIISKGDIAIIWAEMARDKKRYYYLRMRNEGHPIVGMHGDGRCVKLGDSGCTLSFDDRPKGGRYLIPRPNGKCILSYPVLQCVRDWKKYNKILERLVEKFKDWREGNEL